ncbi:LAMI_0F11958g1_1 [Lachancea mirantina]|uniref:LAMI_0F11958g1_1 n=1 Tax=Lachancea mirantina TaxID=1230905 RepID=A0A1G4K2Z2_9SACH|nr:LAMI_0F11958g1_1 [Lachancea mirantina]
MSDELSKLRKQVEELQELVKKQNLLISKTGQSVLELQVAKQRADVDSFDTKFGSSKGSKSGGNLVDTTDFATNEDLVTLVGELQSQLDSIEERSIRRTINSTKIKDDEFLVALPNAYGEIPETSEGWFPRSVGDLEKIPDTKLFRLAKFYELLPPSLEEQEKFEDFVEGKLDNFHINDITEDQIEKELKGYTKDQLTEIFNDVARYLGVKNRRGIEFY